MAKHYSVDEAKKVIDADIVALTAKEEAEIVQFVKFGDTFENKVANKAKVERLDDDYIVEYLGKLDDENEKEKALADYAKLKNEVATDEKGNVKLTTKGNPKKRGFNAGRNWFAKTYPIDASKLDEEITKAGLTKQLEDLWEEYEEAHKNDTNTDDIMNKDQYKRDFYGKRVFVRPAKKK